MSSNKPYANLCSPGAFEKRFQPPHRLAWRFHNNKNIERMATARTNKQKQSWARKAYHRLIQKQKHRSDLKLVITETRTRIFTVINSQFQTLFLRLPIWNRHSVIVWSVLKNQFNRVGSQTIYCRSLTESIHGRALDMHATLDFRTERDDEQENDHSTRFPKFIWW